MMNFAITPAMKPMMIVQMIPIACSCRGDQHAASRYPSNEA
jgi:hypothetical protein